MSRTHTSITLVALSAVAQLSRASAADSPEIGTVQDAPVLTVSLSASSTGRDAKHAVYAPPPGWYVRSHRVVVASRCGITSYAVSTVPMKWKWHANENVTSTDRSNGSVTLSVYKVQGGAHGAMAQDAMTNNRQAITSSHHLLVLDATARGCGLFHGGSNIELTVFAELVYVGP